MTKRWFKFIGKEDGELYSVCIDTESGKSSCTCPFGSFYGKSKKNKGKVCCHIRKALKLIGDKNEL